MFSSFDTPAADPLLAYGLVLAGLLADYVLVACRLFGLLVAIPGFNSSALPLHLRCLLLVVTAAVITPNVSLTARTAFPQRDSQQKFALATDKAVQPVAHQEPEADDAFQVDGADSSYGHRSRSVSRLHSGVEFVRLAGCEVCLGLILGVCANLIVQGFRVAGQLIDQQTGWGIVSATSLDSDDGGTVTGELLFWMGTVMLLVLGGHLVLISTLLGTFQTFPPGSGHVDVELIPVLSQLVQQSLSLALQLSAPVLAIQVLAGLILSHAGTIAPQIQHSGTGVIVRLVLATLVLLLTLSGMTDRMLEAIPASIQLGLGVFT